MHFEILVEDLSGKHMLDVLIPKIIGETHTFEVRSYRGIGRLPKGIIPGSEPQKRILLDQLPRVLQGLGQTFAAYPPDYSAAVVVVCDLDNRCLKKFREELIGLLNRCWFAPATRFCIAIDDYMLTRYACYLIAQNGDPRKEARRAATVALTLEEKLAGQKQVKALEAQRSENRRSLVDAQDNVDQQRADLIANIEGKLTQRAELNPFLPCTGGFHESARCSSL